MLSESAPAKLKDKCALVVGCGGLGCYVVEYLARIGMGKIIIADCDNYCASNMNRQLYAVKDSLGKSKTLIAKQRVRQINQDIQCVAFDQKVTAENIDDISDGCDIVFDCCDNVETRLLLESHCEKKGIVLLHGALNDVYGQVAAVFPGDRTISKIYNGHKCAPPKLSRMFRP